MLVRLSTAIAATCLLSGAALAQGAAKPSDPQIAHIAYTAGQLDIEAAKLAMSVFAEDFPRRPMGRLVAIKRDGARQSALALKRPPEKRFGCHDIPLGAE